VRNSYTNSESLAEIRDSFAEIWNFFLHG